MKCLVLFSLVIVVAYAQPMSKLHKEKNADLQPGLSADASYIPGLVEENLRPRVKSLHQSRKASGDKQHGKKHSDDFKKGHSKKESHEKQHNSAHSLVFDAVQPGLEQRDVQPGLRKLSKRGKMLQDGAVRPGVKHLVKRDIEFELPALPNLLATEPASETTEESSQTETEETETEETEEHVEVIETEEHTEQVERTEETEDFEETEEFGFTTESWESSEETDESWESSEETDESWESSEETDESGESSEETDESEESSEETDESSEMSTEDYEFGSGKHAEVPFSYEELFSLISYTEEQMLTNIMSIPAVGKLESKSENNHTLFLENLKNQIMEDHFTLHFLTLMVEHKIGWETGIFEEEEFEIFELMPQERKAEDNKRDFDQLFKKLETFDKERFLNSMSSTNHQLSIGIPGLH